MNNNVIRRIADQLSDYAQNIYADKERTDFDRGKAKAYSVARELLINAIKRDEQPQEFENDTA